MNVTLMKWTVAVIVVAYFSINIMYKSTIQNTIVQSSADVEFLTESASLGVMRTQANETREHRYIDKEEMVNNLIENVALAQKDHNHQINIDYVFTDVDGNETTDDAAIRGMHYRLSYINTDGERKASAEKSIMFDTIREK